MKKNDNLNLFVETMIKIDNEIFNSIKKKIEKNQPLNMYEQNYITFYNNKIREIKNKKEC